jgi:hypothetical protein
MPFSLPPPAELERRAGVVAFVDTLLEPELASRTYDLDAGWARGERLFAARDNEGSHAFVWFGRAGAFIRGRDARKAAVAAERLFDGLPAAYGKLTREAAFDLDGDSFAAWWDGKRWVVRGGSLPLLGVLDGKPASFARYAARYHEARVDEAALASLHEGDPLTAELLGKLAPEADARWAWALAKKRGFKTRGAAPRHWTAGLARAPEGDAEFKVVRLDDDAMLVVAGRVQLRATKAGLYEKLIDGVRATLRKAGAR